MKEICSIEGCNRPVYVKLRGWCSPHYQKWRTTGDPLAGSRKYFSSEESFKARIKWVGECLIYQGYKCRQGYGRISVNGESMTAHRYAWEREKGPIPEGLEIDHICHNESCVNVRHLRLATRSQNQANLSGRKIRAVSGYRNVSKWNDRWEVWVTKNGVRNYFGTFRDVEEAAEVAKQARLELFGEYAGKG